MKRIVVAGGGTGGHLFPGIAVVEELRRRLPELDVVYVGTERGIEARVLPKAGEKLELLNVRPLKGRGVAGVLRGAAVLPAAGLRSATLLKRLKPDLVLGVGGYASGPMLAAAALLGIKTAVLEQNAFVGLTNRALARFVGRAYLSFEETLPQFPRERARLVGNPVRRKLVEAAHRAAMDPSGFDAGARTVLVLGGSQGSKALNEQMPAVLAQAGVRDLGIRVVHQTGEAMRGAVEERYRALGVDAQVIAFIDDMAEAYGRAMMVIGRAGATTVAELTALGRASVLVPYPHAADDHQRKNAEALARVHAAKCILETDLEAPSSVAAIRELLTDSVARRAMAEAARGQGRPDAAATIVDDLLLWLGSDAPSGADSPDGTHSSGVAAGRASGRRAAGAASHGLRARSDGQLPYRPEAGSWSRPRRSSVPPHRRTGVSDVDSSESIE